MNKAQNLIFISVIMAGQVLAEPRPLPPVVDHSTYPGGKQASSPQSVYETLGRLEQLQAEVQQLRGLVEEQDFTIAELKKRINNIYLDVDQRLMKIEAGNKTTTGVEQQQIINPPPVNLEPAKTLLNNPSKNEKQSYQTAYDALVNGHTRQAIKQFNSFIAEHPNGQFTANAQFWLGEAFSIKEEINSARKAFSAVITNHPDSPKVPDAMLKLGYLEAKAKNPVKAREWLTGVRQKYPGSTAAHLAAKKLQQFK